MRIVAITERSKKYTEEILVILGLAICFAGLTLALGGVSFGDLRSALVGDAGDGLQNVWHLWWIRSALMDQGINPYFTEMLHAPGGTSLVFHPLGITQGVLGIALSPFLSLTQQYNAIFLFGFVMTGISGYLLGRVAGLPKVHSSLVGYLVTFSSYHWNHAQGHLEFIQLQWPILFCVTIVRGWNEKSRLLACSAGLCATITLYSNLYYALYVGIFLCVGVVAALCWSRGEGEEVLRRIMVPFCVGLLPAVPYIVLFAHGVLTDPPLRGHNPYHGTVDLLGLLVPGEFSFFGDATRGLWDASRRYRYEVSVPVGIGILMGVYYVLRERLTRDSRVVTYSAVLFVIFVCIATIPSLRVAGVVFWSVPRDILAWGPLYMLFGISGLPARAIAGAVIVGALLFGYALNHMWIRGRSWRLFAAFLSAVCVVETIPRELPITRPVSERYVDFLRDQSLGAGESVLDTWAHGGQALYFQTVHGKPLVFGYTSRITRSVSVQNRVIQGLVRRRDWTALASRFRVRFVVLPRKTDVGGPQTCAYVDSDVCILQLL